MLPANESTIKPGEKMIQSTSTPTSPGSRRLTGRIAQMAAGVLLASAIFGLLAGTALAAPTMHGTFATPLKQGTITYTAQRAISGGSEGKFVVAGVTRPGSMYRATTGGIGLVWYYGYTGLTAGNALVTQQPDGTYAGSVWFFNKAGTMIDSGTISVTFP
jgi:hypothetical protein